MDPIERSVVANGLKHHVLEWDGGGGTTLLCLHGFLDLSWGFAPIAPALARAGYHVVAPDLRGHGDTERIGAGGYYHFMDYVFDVAELAPALARERLVLVGHSMGGAISALYAGAFPDRVHRLVVMEGLDVSETPVSELPERTARWVQTVQAARARAPKVHPGIEAAADRLQANDARLERPLALFLAEKGTRAEGGGRVFKHDPVHLTRGPYAFRLEAVRPFWERIACPTLLLDGAESDFRSEDRRQRHALFRHAREHTIAGAGHMM
ncbi:MAG: alpha/beta fold hydrolase, partial [Myxococcales bacterium]